jgi:hypothetical protein
VQAVDDQRFERHADRATLPRKHNRVGFLPRLPPLFEGGGVEDADAGEEFVENQTEREEVRATLDPKTDDALPLARRAIALEPGEPGHHLAAARVLWRKGNYDDARKEAQTALSLSRTDQERDGAQQVIKGVDAAKAQAAKPKAAESDASARREGATQQADWWTASCFSAGRASMNARRVASLRWPRGITCDRAATRLECGPRAEAVACLRWGDGS